MKMFIILFLTVFSVTLFAAPRVNNGGGGWLCRKNDASKEVLWVKTADLTKIEFYSPGQLLEKEGDVWDLLQEYHALIKKTLPNLAEILKSHPLNISVKLRSVPYALSYIPDAELRYKPQSSSCPNGLISYVQLVDATLDGHIIYSSRVWDLPQFSNFQKSVLLLHEEIYFSLRKNFGDGSSYRTRQIIGLMFSGLTESELARQVDEVLLDSARSKDGIYGLPNSLALFNVDVTCSYEVNDGEASFSWKPDFKQEDFFIAKNGFQFFVKSSLIDGSPQRLQILDEETGFTTIFEMRDAVPAFNTMGRVQLLLKNEQRKARLRCESKSDLDNDPF